MKHTVWMIWKEPNSRVFNTESRNWSQLIAAIPEERIVCLLIHAAVLAQSRNSLRNCVKIVFFLLITRFRHSMSL
ncbi:hypothetical protein GUJ93_ZPchr0005g14858 [Zizania palustris]|uniref:Uncharacterized protein n=1 Tax=Zizania palustris TaxID=103762 RepID=A0A8J5VGX2_ZIZPA|nr:hypothetical protein GUJ93_ZPchr0005g14858 [Zizania palustris]